MLPAPTALSNVSGGAADGFNVVFGVDTSQQIFCRRADQIGPTSAMAMASLLARWYNASRSHPLG